MKYLYHASFVKDIKDVKPISNYLDNKVSYFTDNYSYSLFYIWDNYKTGINKKHVTAFIKDGIVYYEEKFPNQLLEFYKGVSGYIYYACEDENKFFSKEEAIYYSLEEVKVKKYDYIADVYEKIKELENKGLIKILYYNSLSLDRKKQLINMTAHTIMKKNFFLENNDKRRFYEKYFKDAWSKATNLNLIKFSKVFKCPKCNGKLFNYICENCHYEVPLHNEIAYFSDEENINIENPGHEYIGYDDINIHFSPSAIYWGLNHYGIYQACALDIVNRFGKDITIVDLGCGLGQATIPFALTKATIIGIDISEKMLEFTYKRCEKKYENLQLCKMNAYNLNLEDESVDVIVENAMIHLVDNPEAVYKEIYRVLKKDGKLIRFSSFNLPISNEQKILSINTKNAFNDIRNYYYQTLKELGYEPSDFNNNALEIEKKYFYTTIYDINHPILDYEEEFTEFIKFRIHRLEYKAHSFLQHIPDDIHKLAFEKTDEYAKEKYGSNYRSKKNYSHYKAKYDIYFKK